MNIFTIKFKNFGFLDLIQFVAQYRELQQDVLVAFRLKLEILFDEPLILECLRNQNLKYLTVYLALSLDVFKYRKYLLELLYDYRKIIVNGTIHRMDEIVNKYIQGKQIFE
ncbi:hypothetical protein SS50377_28055 [Spironucleus salmonicida]|uniref:Uncharacterized protein n=1 Tax=Spironucleus salmonicida TaxID=348837 RepID=A0A9P8RUY2_9EUKA|nr:hypothetical protein SS50377_28055 [Spironucleus salmonicida]